MHVYVVKHGNDYQVDDELDGVYQTRADAVEAAEEHLPEDVSLASEDGEWYAVWTPEEGRKAQTAYVDVERVEVDA